MSYFPQRPKHASLRVLFWLELLNCCYFLFKISKNEAKSDLDELLLVLEPLLKIFYKLLKQLNKSHANVDQNIALQFQPPFEEYFS